MKLTRHHRKELERRLRLWERELATNQHGMKSVAPNVISCIKSVIDDRTELGQSDCSRSKP